MPKQSVPVRVVAKYALVQLPGLVLVVLILILIERWRPFPGWVFWGIIAGWVAKDALFFPFVWRAYDLPDERETNPMLGARGVALERLAPSGYVRVGPERWWAELLEDEPPVEVGDEVRVCDMRGLTLIVETVEDVDRSTG